MASYSRRREDSGEPAEGEPAPSDPRDDIDPLDLPEEEQLVYELSAWPIAVHAEVAEALAEAGLPHSWHGTDLVMNQRHEDQADALLAKIERRHGLTADDDANAPAAEPGSEMEYDLSDWNPQARALLTTRLIEADVPFRWEGGLVVVAAHDERLMDEVLDRVEVVLEGEGPEIAGEEEEEGESPMAQLFVATDDLASHPNDRDAILRLNDLFERAETWPVPFGVSAASWDQLLDQVSDLLDLALESDDTDDVRDEAIELRNTLRPLV
jgi:hypothetical protein